MQYERVSMKKEDCHKLRYRFSINSLAFRRAPIQENNKTFFRKYCHARINYYFPPAEGLLNSFNSQPTWSLF